jgi:thioesterase domain-containing protein
VYAIQARGLEERARADHSVEAAAKRNILAMRKVQPHGPYLIGGYSYGGFVAFEMACRLRELGEEVAHLVILDTTGPINTFPVSSRMKARAEQFRKAAPTSRLQRAAVVAARAGRFGVKSLYAHAERRVSLSSAGILPRKGYEQYELFLRLNARMSYEYHPTRTFDGPLLVVRGRMSDGRPPNAPMPLELEGIEKSDYLPDSPRHLNDLGWSKLVTGPVTVVDVPADHLGLLRAPAVEKVGQVVGDTLR